MKGAFQYHTFKNTSYIWLSRQTMAFSQFVPFSRVMACICIVFGDLNVIAGQNHLQCQDWVYVLPDLLIFNQNFYAQKTLISKQCLHFHSYAKTSCQLFTFYNMHVPDYRQLQEYRYDNALPRKVYRQVFVLTSMGERLRSMRRGLAQGED